MKRRLLLILLACFTGLVHADSGHLRILLTNDDGYDSAGLKAVRAALLGDGHEVVVVAPFGQRSGSGMQVTLGEFALVEQSPGVWSVDASPADAVSVALHVVMADRPPDLVVSGANFGQNLGANVFISGTVGAAMMAVLDGVPAIAVSVGIDLGEAHAEPVRFPTTLAAFADAAAFTARIVAILAARPGSALLPGGHVLNVNYPALPAAAVKAPRWVPAGPRGGFAMSYPSHAQGRLESTVTIDTKGQGDTATDTAMFARGHVTLSLLRPDWNAAADAGTALRFQLEQSLVPVPVP